MYSGGSRCTDETNHKGMIMFAVVDLSTNETLLTFEKRAKALKAARYLNEWAPDRRVGVKKERVGVL